MTDETPTVLNDDPVVDDAVSPPARKQRAPRVDELAILREEIAALRAQIVADKASSAGVSPPNPIYQPNAQPKDSGIVAEFWTISKHHTLRLKRPTGDGFIHFRNGYFAARTEADADLIREQAKGVAFEKNWPDHLDPPRDQTTGFAPKSWEAWQEFQRWAIARPFMSM